LFRRRGRIGRPSSDLSIKVLVLSGVVAIVSSLVATVSQTASQWLLARQEHAQLNESDEAAKWRSKAVLILLTGRYLLDLRFEKQKIPDSLISDRYTEVNENICVSAKSNLVFAVSDEGTINYSKKLDKGAMVYFLYLALQHDKMERFKDLLASNKADGSRVLCGQDAQDYVRLLTELEISASDTLTELGVEQGAIDRWTRNWRLNPADIATVP